jgi:hypothetical protein
MAEVDTGAPVSNTCLYYVFAFVLLDGLMMVVMMAFSLDKNLTSVHATIYATISNQTPSMMAWYSSKSTTKDETQYGPILHHHQE